jgi:hypothetical protein
MMSTSQGVNVQSAAQFSLPSTHVGCVLSEGTIGSAFRVAFVISLVHTAMVTVLIDVMGIPQLFVLHTPDPPNEFLLCIGSLFSSLINCISSVSKSHLHDVSNVRRKCASLTREHAGVTWNPTGCFHSSGHQSGTRSVSLMLECNAPGQ